MHRALRRGFLKRPIACEVCSYVPGDLDLALYGHHEDHSEPLQVEWLCGRCHGKRNFESYLARVVGPALWRELVSKAKREGISMRALMLGWLKQWVES